MDTKLKKSKYHPLIKFIAILLTIVFAFLAGFNGLCYLRRSIYYASDNLDFKETPVFLQEMQSTLYNISTLKSVVGFYSEDMTPDEYKKTDRAKEIIKEYNKLEDKAIKIFNTIQELKKLTPDIETDNGTYKVTDDGTVYMPEYNQYVQVYEFNDYYNDYYFDDTNVEVSDNYTSVAYYDDEDYTTYEVSDEELFKIKESYDSYNDWNYKYRQLRSAIFGLVDDATSVETIKACIETEKDNALYDAYNTDIGAVSHHMKQLINVAFILKNNKTGSFISNIPVSEHIEFINNIRKNQLYYASFDGSNLRSPVVSPNRSTNILKSLTDNGNLNQVSLDERLFKSYFEGYTLYLKLNSNVEQGDAFYNATRAFDEVSYNTPEGYSAATLVFALLSISCFIFCCVISGRRKDDSVKLGLCDKIPFVLYFGVTCALLFFIGAGAVFGVCTDHDQDSIVNIDEGLKWLVTENAIQIYVSLCVSLISLFLLSFVLYVVRNVKAGTFSNRFIIAFTAKKISQKISDRRETILSVKQIKIQTIIFFVAYAAVNLSLMLITLTNFISPVVTLGILAIYNCITGVYVFLYLSDIKRLEKIAEETRNGNFCKKIEPKTFVAPLRGFAIDLDACRDGIENAINEAVKGEHLKTELITNVSHDLKTPLTSIINYVSLLKMDDIESEEKLKYIEILDEKSKKLKRLIEDLTEASKANSGNIKMDVAQVNLNELALQAVGENSDVLENAGLDIVLTEKEKEILVKADSQHTFRIIDNLFSNARKYSLNGTRVYIDVYKENEYGVFSIKNISREKLNIAPDELTERFVRGDNSRSTDGSGLGLSIARSFAELQNGIFIIEIDGDMFKVTVKLPLA